MNIKNIAFIIISTIIVSINSCPTCVGTIQHDSPPFFYHEFDQSHDTFVVDLVSTGTNS